eukprot:gene10-147_t
MSKTINVSFRPHCMRVLGDCWGAGDEVVSENSSIITLMAVTTQGISPIAAAGFSALFLSAAHAHRISRLRRLILRELQGGKQIHQAIEDDEEERNKNFDGDRPTVAERGSATCTFLTAHHAKSGGLRVVDSSGLLLGSCKYSRAAEVAIEHAGWMTQTKGLENTVVSSVLGLLSLVIALFVVLALIDPANGGPWVALALTVLFIT